MTREERAALTPEQREQRRKDARAAKLKGVMQRHEATKLRLSGASYAAIGSTLGITKQAAWKLVGTALREAARAREKDGEDLLTLDLERTESMLFSLWSSRGNPRVADTIIRLLAHRATLLGYGAPVRVEATGPAGEPIEHRHSLAGLSDDQLAQYEALLLAMQGSKPAVAHPPGANGVPKNGSNGVHHPPGGNGVAS